jgi:S-adenosylmethionine decarboxylase proenzyme
MIWFYRLAFSVFVFISAAACAVEELGEIYHFKGVHFLASYCDCDPDALKDLEQLQQVMLAAVEECGATILSEAHYVFPPDGLTMVILLSESHASIHTYPEHSACFVDLFTCGEKCSSEKFDAALRAYLKPGEVNQRTFIRKKDIHD